MTQPYKRLQQIINEVYHHKPPPVGLTQHLQHHGILPKPESHPVKTYKVFNQGTETERWVWETWEFKEAAKQWNITEEDGNAYFSGDDGLALGPKVDLPNINTIDTEGYDYVVFYPR